jgi:hypothetical protein
MLHQSLLYGNNIHESDTAQHKKTGLVRSRPVFFMRWILLFNKGDPSKFIFYIAKLYAGEAFV